MSSLDVKVPDIGDFTDVPVIEIFVKPGDTVAAEDSLVTLESDKATMDVPAPVAGTVPHHEHIHDPGAQLRHAAPGPITAA
jgi:pyruvate/2-oxoglutarate dehydrogenase complex dihydrolipoamide acyltransferase (E2) component